jgi:hypothetical protein
MRFLCIVLCMSLHLSASAELMLKSSDGSQELRLYESLCSHGETLSHIPQEFRDRFKNARILDPKGTIEHYGCYATNEELALVIFEDGSRTILELSKFKETTI